MTASRIREGYLLLADISGYTAFLTGTEFEHATEIIEDLTRAVLSSFAAPVKVVKLEGDAVFAYIPAAAFAQAERVLDLLEATYCGFTDRKDDMRRATTCACSACSQIGTLDLKFIAHFGAFILQDLAGVEDLAGPDVILVHRLLKNSVVSTTGVPAYAFLTDAVLARVQQPLTLPAHIESYDSFGEVHGAVADIVPQNSRVHDSVGPRKFFILRCLRVTPSSEGVTQSER